MSNTHLLVDPVYLARLQAREPAAIREMIDNEGAVVYDFILPLEQDFDRAYDIMMATVKIVMSQIDYYHPGQGSLFKLMLQIAIQQSKADHDQVLARLNDYMLSLP